jgi:KaiC/GvpD/RAD55 family RecA-like ATPase
MQSLNSVALPDNWNEALSTGFDAFDELMGNCGGINGFRSGKVVLLSAQSGTGKTRLCLTVGAMLIERDNSLVYAHFTGEQSTTALAMTGKSMGITFGDNVLADSESHWDTIEKQIIQNKVKIVVIDSYPMLTFNRHPETNKELDTKQRCKKIADFTAKHGIYMILLNHTDKKGNRAGRNELMHLVDVAYTMHKDVIDEMKVIKFLCDKNREGTPVSRAFPFAGTWDLNCPVEIDDIDENESGEKNFEKVALRKNSRREIVLTAIGNLGGTLTRNDLESGQFFIDEIPYSTIKTILREFVQEKIMVTESDVSGRPGKPAIKSWSIA